MSFFVDTSYRSTKTEIMDDLSMEGELLRDTLDKLGNINKWLGGNRVTLNGVKQLLKHHDPDIPVTIMDLGCGHGDLLRLIADYGRKHNFTFNLLGIDANKDAIAYAKQLSEDYSEITYKSINVFSDDFKMMRCDIALSTLFLHHFTEEQIEFLLQTLKQTTETGIVINDLHRNRLAYALFKVLGLFISNHMIVKDGLTSILRAFKRRELEALSNQLKLNSQIQWKWAFRYQWLISI